MSNKNKALTALKRKKFKTGGRLRQLLLVVAPELPDM